MVRTQQALDVNARKDWDPDVGTLPLPTLADIRRQLQWVEGVLA